MPITIKDLYEAVNARFDKLEQRLNNEYVPRKEFREVIKRIELDIADSKIDSAKAIKTLNDALDDFQESQRRLFRNAITIMSFVVAIVQVIISTVR